MKKKILDTLRKHSGKTFRKRELAQRMGVSEKNYRTFRRTVNELLNDRSLIRARGGALVLASTGERVRGTLALTSHGYGFVSTDERSDDIFVGRKNLKGALNGDTVDVIVLPATRRHRSEGIINQVVTRKGDQFIGTVIGNRGHFKLLIEPVSPRRGIVLDTKKGDSISDGDIVLAKVTDWGSPNSPVVTKLIERVGSVENAEDDMAVVCYKYDLTPEFPNRVEKESSKWTDQDI